MLKLCADLKQLFRNKIKSMYDSSRTLVRRKHKQNKKKSVNVAKVRRKKGTLLRILVNCLDAHTPSSVSAVIISYS